MVKNNAVCASYGRTIPDGQASSSDFPGGACTPALLVVIGAIGSRETMVMGSWSLVGQFHYRDPALVVIPLVSS